MRVSRTGIDEIKRRNDLAEVVTEHGIELKRRGRTLFGLCAFHAEKTASFSVNREVGLFHCFGCGAGGDVIGFVVRFHQVSFPEALRHLADRAGLELEKLMENSESQSARPPAARVQSEGLRQRMAQQLHEKAATRYARLAARGERP